MHHLNNSNNHKELLGCRPLFWKNVPHPVTMPSLFLWAQMAVPTHTNSSSNSSKCSCPLQKRYSSLEVLQDLRSTITTPHPSSGEAAHQTLESSASQRVVVALG